MSYVAVCTNAAAASAWRSARVNPPWARAACSCPYWSGEVTTATEAWFFAAPRTIDGPPMSICSIVSSWPAPAITVSTKG